MTYVLITLGAIVAFGFWFGYWVHGRASTERIFASSLPVESAVSLLQKKLKGRNPFARVTRNGHTVSRAYEKSVPKAGMSLATLNLRAEVNPLATKLSAGGERRTTLITMSMSNVRTPRWLFMPAPQAAWTALRRQWAVMRALKAEDAALTELTDVQITALRTGDPQFLAIGAVAAEEAARGA